MSFRSKGNFRVNEFAAKFFNGGGHFNAAGGQSELPLEEVVATFRKEIANYKEALNSIEL
jgi:phosphoesterase RecJ-like protein